ncbi:putative membrane protein [Plasmodium gaboni]|uniref:Putative membrane protein n=1 Tax=Plasmodium gaboni TaxID=647221 RepID=A0A151LB76_9APIC|nr:putative membrane protein [Plasmodium gaboni]KYN96215.1 putative membrane protein [Plasmodium gaboni]
MCFLCNHDKKGGIENTAIGTWSKGISLIICSSLFLLHFVNDDELTLLNKKLADGEYKMIYYLSIYNLIGASCLIFFSVLGHFVYKSCLRPIYLGSFIVSLFLISSGVYTTSISKNISLKIIGIMDALKYHPDYMLLNKINKLDSIDINELSSDPQIVVVKSQKPPELPDTTFFDATKVLEMIKDRQTFLETKKEILYKSLSREDLMKMFKDIKVSDQTIHKDLVQNTLLDLYEKIKNIRLNFDIYDKFYKFMETNSSAFITNSEKIKNFTDKFQKIFNQYNKSLFNTLKYELVKHDDEIIKIYLDSIDKIKKVKDTNKNAKLNKYIDDLKERNILILSSVLLLMSFIYIHKGATLTTKSSMSISLMYAPSMSYLITLACIFVCSGIFFFSIIGLVLYVFSLILIFFLIFSQCFCERLFKLFMGFIYTFLFLFSLLIAYILIEDFNEGSKVYNEYKKNDYNDFYWVLLNKRTYEYFKSFVLFSYGQMFLVCIALCAFMIIYSLYCIFYTFRSICNSSEQLSSSF